MMALKFYMSICFVLTIASSITKVNTEDLFEVPGNFQCSENTYNAPCTRINKDDGYCRCDVTLDIFSGEESAEEIEPENFEPFFGKGFWPSDWTDNLGKDPADIDRKYDPDFFPSEEYSPCFCMPVDQICETAPLNSNMFKEDRPAPVPILTENNHLYNCEQNPCPKASNFVADCIRPNIKDVQYNGICCTQPE